MEKITLIITPFIIVIVGFLFGFLFGKYKQKFVKNKEYYKGKRIEEVFCADCTFSKYSCYKKGHCVTITLDNKSMIALLNGINTKASEITTLR